MIYRTLHLHGAMVLALATLLMILGNRSAYAQETANLDTLVQNCLKTYSTAAGLRDCDILIREATKAKSYPHLCKGLQLKATSYVAMGRYEDAIAVCDSVDKHTDLKEKEPEQFYNLQLQKASGLLMIGKASECIDVTKHIYDAVKEMPDKEGKQKEKLYVGSIKIMAVANIISKQFGRAEELFDEGIEICREAPKELHTNFIDLSFCKFANIIEEKTKSGNNAESERFIGQFAKEIEDYAKYAKGHRADEAIKRDVLFYTFISKSYQMNLKAMKGDRRDADKLMRSIDSLHAVSDLVRMRKKDFYAAKMNYYNLTEEYTKALAYNDSIIKIYREDDDYDNEYRTLKDRLNILSKSDTQDEIDMMLRMSCLADTIIRNTTTESVQELTTQMGLDKAKMETAQLKAERQNWILAGALAIMTAISIIIGFLVVQSRKQKRVLEQEVERQTHEIKKKNRDITDSINYAQKIQNAILPDLNNLTTEGIDGAYVFFKPCNIVSGDFYWSHHGEGRIMVACADCTGHGVPGAFMSMIGTTLLNEICARNKDLTPGEMLEVLDGQLINVLRQKSNAEVQDGMDIAMMRYDSDTNKLQVAGARRPIYYMRDGKLEEIKGTKRSIGDSDERARQLTFETTTIEVHKGDTLYMCSDGIADQFGGQNETFPEGKRMKSTGLKKMIEEVSAFNMSEQSDKLNELYEKWKGTCYQVDDVSLVAIKF